ncbi:MAG TPA: serine/threonine-protein kinase, partial [Gemmataceae bacterium]|nr:serine/threonine-protein kinase [Gemmataceae bacterium]
MNDAENQREAELADFLAEARTNFRCGRIPDLSTWQSRYPDQIGELLGLLKTVQDLDTLLNEAPVSATVDYVAGNRQAGKGTAVPGPLPAQIGRYRILEWLGSGGMGTVYRAHDPHLDREVALKVPRLEPLWDDRALAVQRFLREARAAAGVRHPHVCPIYDAGEQAGVPYVVMAFIQGPNLTKLLRPEGLEPRLASKLVSKVALGLEAVHAQGIIHRDLKPGNILLDAAGEPLVTDFGLACLRQEQKPLTVYGVLLGTPGYMAPEQVTPQAGPLGPWTDIYSLGVVLYQLLTGRTPFVESGLTLCYQIAHEKPPPPSQFRGGLDPALEAIVLKALAQRPQDRFASAGQFSEALQGWLRGEPVNQHPPAVTVPPQTSPMTVRTDLPGGGAVTITLEGDSKTASQLEVTVEQQKATARKRRHKLRIKITVALSLLLPVVGLLALLPWLLSQKEESVLSQREESRLAQGQHDAIMAEGDKQKQLAEVKGALEKSQQLMQPFSAQRNVAEAQALLERALATSRKLMGEDHPTTVACYQQLGRIFSAQGKFAEAEGALTKAISITQKLLGNNHPETVARYQQLAQI